MMGTEGAESEADESEREREMVVRRIIEGATTAMVVGT